MSHETTTRRKSKVEPSSNGKPGGRWTLEFTRPSGKRSRRVRVQVLGPDGQVVHTDTADMDDAAGRRKLSRHIAGALGIDAERVEKAVDERWCGYCTEERGREEAGPVLDEGEMTADCPWRGLTLPGGYAITPGGQVFDAADPKSPQVLARTPVWVESLVRNSDGDGWGSLLVWVDRDGRLHRRAFPAECYHDRQAGLIPRLADGGLAIVPGREAALIRYLAAFGVERRARSVRRLGWTGSDAGSPVFVLPDRTIGESGSEPTIYLPEYASAQAAIPRSRGTLEKWQTLVSPLADGNPLLAFGLSVAFAGPILRFAGVEGGVYHLHGQTSRGKTTTAQLAASVWGSGADPAEAPAESYVKRWNTTGNAVEAIAADHCDSLLVMDEIGEANVHDFGRLVYQFAGGQGKARLSKDAALREARTWRVPVLSTGEVPVEHVIEAAGRRKARAGQLVRAVDIPVTADDRGIIRQPGDLEPATFVQRIKQRCGKFYGTAGPAFVEWLTKQGTVSEVSTRVRKRMQEAYEKLLPPGVTPEVGRVVRRFALVLAAGWLACESGVLPLGQKAITRAVRTALRLWLEGHGGGAMERAVEDLREFLLANMARLRERTHEDKEHPVRDLVGYRDDGRKLLLLTRAGAREALDGHPVTDVMRHLQRVGLLEAGADGLMSVHRVAGIERTVRLYAIKMAVLGGETDEPEVEDDD